MMLDPVESLGQIDAHDPNWQSKLDRFLNDVLEDHQRMLRATGRSKSHLIWRLLGGPPVRDKISGREIVDFLCTSCKAFPETIICPRRHLWHIRHDRTKSCDRKDIGYLCISCTVCAETIVLFVLSVGPAADIEINGFPGISCMVCAETIAFVLFPAWFAAAATLLAVALVVSAAARAAAVVAAAAGAAVAALLVVRI